MPNRIDMIHLTNGPWRYAILRDKITLVSRYGDDPGKFVTSIFLTRDAFDFDDGLTVDQSFEEIVRRLGEGF
jgi:hypothetical protein